MAIPHAAPGEIIDLMAPFDPSQTTTLVKSSRLAVIRLVLPEGKEIPPHDVPGEITVQCLAGRIVFQALGQSQELEPGKLVYLAGGDGHALTAVEPSVALVTILL